MDKLSIQLCPETGICSIIKANGTKVDLMPDEVSSLREALVNLDLARNVVADVDAGFAQSLAPEELAQLAATLKKPRPTPPGR